MISSTLALALSFLVSTKPAFVQAAAISTAYKTLPKEWPPVPCKELKVRKEWSELTNAEKTSYLDAVVCLKNTPAAEPNYYEGAKSLFDTFQGEHIHQMQAVHWAGPFLPWHRLFLKTYEDALATCGYKGAQPYWSWARDVAAGSLEANPMFDPVLGFGGNGPFVNRSERVISPSQLLSPFLPTFTVQTEAEQRANLVLGTGGGCVPDGRFAQSNGWNVSMGMGQSTDYNPHCLRRDFNFDFLSMGNYSMIAECLRQPNFVQFHYCVERRLDGDNIHGSGHGGIGMEMLNLWSSPGDPLFMMHHANLDRVWWEWQELGLPERLHDVGGNAYSLDWNNTLAPNVTTDFLIQLGALHSEISLGELLDTRGSGLCYEYAADPPPAV